MPDPTPPIWILAPILELLELLLPDAPDRITYPVRSRLPCANRLPCTNRVRHLNGPHRTVFGRA